MTEKLLAQIHVPGLPEGLGGGINPARDFGLTSAGKLISASTNLLLIIATIAAFIFFVLGGLQWITAGGDKAQLETARNKITNALLGLIIVAAAWAVWIIVGVFIGVDVNKLPFPTVTDGFVGGP